jgi:hypothetical protein
VDIGQGCDLPDLNLPILEGSVAGEAFAYQDERARRAAGGGGAFTEDGRPSKSGKPAAP